MSDNKETRINVTSSAVEKGLDIAKDFLGKLIMPAVEEVGLLMKDHVAAWRLRNQIKILNKAENICEKNNINTKSISLKLLCPYLEYASLEEDSDLQDLWANLLVNYIDINSKLRDTSYPEVLSKLSSDDIKTLQIIFERSDKDSLRDSGYTFNAISKTLGSKENVSSAISHLIYLNLVFDGNLANVDIDLDREEFRSMDLSLTTYGRKFIKACSC